jgi:hypothetical protein
MILSGPKSSASQVRNALVRARVAVDALDPDDVGFGVPEDETDEPQEHIRCHGDIDKATTAAEPLRYRLRSHWREEDRLAVAIEPAVSPLEARVADLEAKLAALTGATSGS